MKYFVECPDCGRCYEQVQNSVPCTCMNCGSGSVKVTLENTKTRRRAIAAMQKMDELKPRIYEARKAYMDLVAEYEIECNIIRKYSSRGIVTPEEKDRYMFRKNESLKRETLTNHLKDHWRKNEQTHPEEAPS